MNLPELCIRRSVMTTLLMAAFVIFGLIAYRALPVSELPSVDFPTVSVSAALPGASPENGARMTVYESCRRATFAAATLASRFAAAAASLVRISLTFSAETKFRACSAT